MLVVVIAASAVVPAVVRAADEQVKPGEKWSESECRTVGGDFESGTSSCYAKPVPTELGVKIGGLKQATIAQYVAAAYTYVLGAAAVLAVIMIMVGGFRWITAAGGPQIEGARKMIIGAIVGLVLAFASYLLLQTVNPAIVSLTPPRIKLVRAAYLDILRPGNIIGDSCWTIKDAQACADSCKVAGLDKARCECTVVPDPAFVTFGKIVTIGAVGAVGAAAIGVPTLIASAKVLGARLVGSIPGILKFGWKHAGKIGVGALAYSVVSSDEPNPGEKGICLPFAVGNIPIGGVCDPSRPDGCEKLPNGQFATCERIGEYLGMCISGAENTGCNPEGEGCATITDEATGLVTQLLCCPVGGLGTCQKSCGARGVDALCSNDGQCASGKCVADPTRGASQYCQSGGSGSWCDNLADCLEGYQCPKPFYNLTSPSLATATGVNSLRQCQTKQGRGANCCSNTECISDSCTLNATCRIFIGTDGNIASDPPLGTCN